MSEWIATDWAFACPRDVTEYCTPSLSGSYPPARWKLSPKLSFRNPRPFRGRNDEFHLLSLGYLVFSTRDGFLRFLMCRTVSGCPSHFTSAALMYPFPVLVVLPDATRDPLDTTKPVGRSFNYFVGWHPPTYSCSSCLNRYFKYIYTYLHVTLSYFCQLSKICRIETDRLFAFRQVSHYVLCCLMRNIKEVINIFGLCVILTWRFPYTPQVHRTLQLCRRFDWFNCCQRTVKLPNVVNR